MSFQGYLDNIEKKTGQSPSDFQAQADAKGFSDQGKLKTSTKAGEIVAWLKADYDLGHGHAMAIYAYLKGKRD